MVLHMRRFTKNNFFVEKNPTIVNFPVKNLKLQDIVPVPTGAPHSGARCRAAGNLLGLRLPDLQAWSLINCMLCSTILQRRCRESC